MRSNQFAAAWWIGVSLFLGIACWACGPEREQGTFLVQMRFVSPTVAGVRGVLSGVVDTVRLSARKKAKDVAQQSCDYEQLGCALSEVPAGSGYELVAEAFDGLDLVYAGTASDLKVEAGQTTIVAIDMEPAYEQDRYAPAAAEDLTATAEGQDVVLNWTASGDDGLVGRASSYLIYWASEPISEDNLALANEVDGDRPSEQGQAEELRILSLPAGSLYYFSLKIVDEQGNCSSLSNLASAQVD